MSRNLARFDAYQLVTNLIIERLEQGTVPWRCPWHRQSSPPVNFYTGKPYRGTNVFLLGLHHFASPYWMTFCQTTERGGRIRKGERGATVVKWGQYEKLPNEQERGQEKKESCFLRVYTVFNAVQIEGVEFPMPNSLLRTDQSRFERADSIVKAMPHPPTVSEGRFDRACYKKSIDTVEMPAFESFETPEDFHATRFHEFVHATGHPSRLNRLSLVENDGFGGQIYSQEELVAEMGAAFLASEAGIVRDDHKQSASYINGWLDVLRKKDHRRWIVQAASQASYAADYILGQTPAAFGFT